MNEPFPNPFHPTAPPEAQPEVDPPTPVPAQESADLPPDHEESDREPMADWKQALRGDFEMWLASLDEPETTEGDEIDALNDAPDLYSFHAQLAAISADSRKANRRTAEAISQWGDVLARFESGLAPLRETTAQLAAAQPKAEALSRAHCLILVELLDRMRRMALAFQQRPPTRRSWFGADPAWPKAWQNQAQALDILVSHLEKLLGKEGVTRIETDGRPFDPALMMAVAAEPDASRAPQTIIEETAAGYLRHGELLRTAQVKVSRAP